MGLARELITPGSRKGSGAGWIEGETELLCVRKATDNSRVFFTVALFIDI